MDNLVTSVHQRKATKKIKPKKEPIKVVYITNPMKVKTCASKFRALVQKLTGQDAEFPEPSKFNDIDDVGANQTVQDAAKIVLDDDDHAQEDPLVDPCPKQSDRVDDFPFEQFDDVFTPQLMENFPGLLPSSLYYESLHVDALRSLDAV